MNRWERPATGRRKTGFTAVNAACGEGKGRRRGATGNSGSGGRPECERRSEKRGGLGVPGSAYRCGNATGSGESSAPRPSASRRRRGPAIGLVTNDLVQRVFDDPRGPFLLEDGDQVPDDLLVDDDLQGEPAGLAQCGDRRVLHRRQHLEDPVEVFATDVHLEADLLLAGERLEEQGDVFDLLPLPSILPRLRFAMRTVVDSRIVSTTRRLFARRLLPVSVSSTIASARRGAFTRWPPGELDLGLDPFLFR